MKRITVLLAISLALLLVATGCHSGKKTAYIENYSPAAGEASILAFIKAHEQKISDNDVSGFIADFTQDASISIVSNMKRNSHTTYSRKDFETFLTAKKQSMKDNLFTSKVAGVCGIQNKGTVASACYVKHVTFLTTQTAASRHFQVELELVQAGDSWKIARAVENTFSFNDFE